MKRILKWTVCFVAFFFLPPSGSPALTLLSPSAALLQHVERFCFSTISVLLWWHCCGFVAVFGGYSGRTVALEVMLRLSWCCGT